MMKKYLSRMLFTVCLLSVASTAFAAQRPGNVTDAVGAVDTAGGYGWQVLERVLPLWQPPAGGSGVVIVAVRVGSNGEVLFCEPRKSSGNQTVDLAVCSTVSKAGPFAAPSYGVPVEVFLSLPAGGGSGAASTSSAASAPAYNPGAQSYQPGPSGSGTAGESGNYADVVMSQITPHIRVPAGFKGEATVVVHLRVDEQGRMLDTQVVESTASSRNVEQAVLDGIKKAGNVPQPPSGVQQLVLTFTLRGL